MTLLGSSNGIVLRNDDLDYARDMGIDIESYAEKQDRNKEVQDAWRQVMNNQLEADTQKSLAMAEESEQKIKAFDQQYQKVYGFEPTHFTIVNDVQLHDDVDRDLKMAQEQFEAQKFIAQAKEDTKRYQQTYKSLVSAKTQTVDEE